MRLFLATNFPEPVIRDLNETISRFKSRLPAASWVRPETQHLTFAFLGEQPETLIGALTEPLTKALETIPRFEAALQAAGVFPNIRHARVGWIGLDPDSNFATVARAVRHVVTTAGVKLDNIEFRPHLTLMRMRDPWPPSSIDLFTRTMRDYRSAPFTVDTVTLYSSKLDSRGATHTPLQTFALA